jgi:aspartate kinase
MLEMASMGSKVLQIRAVEFAGKYNVPLRVLHSFQDGPGTLISLEEDDAMEAPTIAGIAFNRDEAKLTILGVPDMPGVAYRILGPDRRRQYRGRRHRPERCRGQQHGLHLYRGRVVIWPGPRSPARTAEELGAREVRSDSRIAKVSVVGVGMRSHAGVASQMFAALAEVGINIQMITTSEIKISVIIEEKFLELAVRALHSAFGWMRNRWRRALPKATRDSSGSQRGIADAHTHPQRRRGAAPRRRHHDHGGERQGR